MNLPNAMTWNDKDEEWRGASWAYEISHDGYLVLVDSFGDEVTFSREDDAEKEALIWAIEAPQEITTLRAIAREVRAISSWVVGQAVLSDGDFRRLRELLDRLELKE